MDPLTKDGLIYLWSKIKALVNTAKPLVIKNATISVSSWASDSTFSDYPYKATLQVTGVTSNHACTTMVPDHTNADLQYLFGPYVNTGAGTLEVWANSKPTAAITIELMIFELTG